MVGACPGAIGRLSVGGDGGGVLSGQREEPERRFAGRKYKRTCELKEDQVVEMRSRSEVHWKPRLENQKLSETSQRISGRDSGLLRVGPV